MVIYFRLVAGSVRRKGVQRCHKPSVSLVCACVGSIWSRDSIGRVYTTAVPWVISMVTRRPPCCVLTTLLRCEDIANSSAFSSRSKSETHKVRQHALKKRDAITNNTSSLISQTGSVTRPEIKAPNPGPADIMILQRGLRVQPRGSQSGKVPDSNRADIQGLSHYLTLYPLKTKLS